MRIRKLIVKNLFGIFNHAIPLNLDDHITIIAGPNGFGKTVILNMVRAVFSEEYDFLLNIAFDGFILYSDNSIKLSIKRHESKLDFRINLSEHKIIKYKYTKSHSGDENRYSNITHDYPFVADWGVSAFVPYMNDRSNKFRKKMPEELKNITDSIDIKDIDTQRLLILDREQKGVKGSKLTPSVETYSKQLASMIQVTLAEYAEFSQNLDRSFPIRLVESGHSERCSIEDLRKRFNDLEIKRINLTSTGLLDKQDVIDLGRLLEKIDEGNVEVFSIYVKDIEQKLSKLEELSRRIDTFLKLITNRFLYKTLSISKKEGFILTTVDGKILAPSNCLPVSNMN